MIKEKDGIHIELEEKFVADSRKALGDVNIASHAHMDHAFQGEGKVVASELTRKLLESRLGRELEIDEHPDVELLDSGHILGSRAALIDTGDEKILYTGDVSTRDRAYLKGFEPVGADILVTEATYGVPAYSFPDQQKIEEEIKAWIEETESPFLFGYSLGKAQKLQYIVQEVTDRPLIAHGSVLKMNDVMEEHTGLSFDARPYTENKDLLKDGEGVFIGPTRFSSDDGLNELIEESGGVKAGFSGWGMTSNYRHRGGYDQVFPFSDHCGFEDLVEMVEKVNPEKVYTHHGFDEELASYLKKEKGVNARALKQNQASLTDF
ncbi:MAG: MBL fold metallo-hydrolase RNA specificity domain-containing protein [Candidatus Nanohaloarchaea archaeon]